MEERQLGQQLAAALPKHPPIDPLQVVSVCQANLPADDPRLEALREMAHQPEFLALITNEGSDDHRQVQREALLQRLGERHGPVMAVRLRTVLEGLLDTRSAGPILEADWQHHWQVLQDASMAPDVATTASPNPQDKAREWEPPRPAESPRTTGPRQEGRGRTVWWLVSSLAIAGTLGGMASTLSAFRANHFCSSLGFCSVAAIETANNALETAQQAVRRLHKADSIASYQQHTRELERRIGTIEHAGVFTEAQRISLKRLRYDVRTSLRRLEREEAERRIVRETKAEIGTGKSLPRALSENKRLRLLSQLRKVRPDSFSHGEAVALRELLRPPPPVFTPPPDSPWIQPSRPEEAVTSPVNPAPAPPPRPPAPPRESGSGQSAPYRDEPLW